MTDTEPEIRCSTCAEWDIECPWGYAFFDCSCECGHRGRYLSVLCDTEDFLCSVCQRKMDTVRSEGS